MFIPTTGLVDEKAIKSAPKLKLIVQPAAGHDNIAVDTAASLGIPVCTAPGTTLFTGTSCCHAAFDSRMHASCMHYIVSMPHAERLCRAIWSVDRSTSVGPQG